MGIHLLGIYTGHLQYIVIPKVLMDTGTAHVCTRAVHPLVRVPPLTLMGGWTARMWAVSGGARVRVHFFPMNLVRLMAYYSSDGSSARRTLCYNVRLKRNGTTIAAEAEIPLR